MSLPKYNAISIDDTPMEKKGPNSTPAIPPPSMEKNSEQITHELSRRFLDAVRQCMATEGVRRSEIRQRLKRIHCLSDLQNSGPEDKITFYLFMALMEAEVPHKRSLAPYVRAAVERTVMSFQTQTNLPRIQVPKEECKEGEEPQKIRRFALDLRHKLLPVISHALNRSEVDPKKLVQQLREIQTYQDLFLHAMDSDFMEELLSICDESIALHGTDQHIEQALETIRETFLTLHVRPVVQSGHDRPETPDRKNRGS